jgi:hypothetical protein
MNGLLRKKQRPSCVIHRMNGIHDKAKNKKTEKYLNHSEEIPWVGNRTSKYRLEKTSFCKFLNIFFFLKISVEKILRIVR